MKVKLFLVFVGLSVVASGCAVFEPPPSYATSRSQRFQIEEPRWKKEWREKLESPSPVKSVLRSAANLAGSGAAARQ